MALKCSTTMSGQTFVRPGAFREVLNLPPLPPLSGTHPEIEDSSRVPSTQLATGYSTHLGAGTQPSPSRYSTADPASRMPGTQPGTRDSPPSPGQREGGGREGPLPTPPLGAAGYSTLPGELIPSTYLMRRVLNPPPGTHPERLSHAVGTQPTAGNSSPEIFTRARGVGDVSPAGCSRFPRSSACTWATKWLSSSGHKRGAWRHSQALPRPRSPSRQR